MAITSYGYDGPITEPQMAQIMPRSGAALVGVVGGGDLKVTAGATAGQVNVAPGTAWGAALVDVSDSIATVTQSSLPSSGSRWDLVVLRRDWTPPGGSSSFVIITGSATKQLPAELSSASSSSTSGRNVFPGTVDDQPLALVRWQAGYTSPQEIIDLRLWAANGGAVAKDTLVQSYLTQIGTTVRIGTDEWVLDTDSNGSPVWTNLDAPGPWVNISAATNWSQSIGKCRKVARGAILEVDLETKYTGSSGTKAGWFIGYLPAGYKPTYPQLVTGMAGQSFGQDATVFIGPNDIQIAAPSEGQAAFKIQTIVALR